MVNLWLDDMRPAPDGWTWCRSVQEATRLLREHAVDYASLDHDLGEYSADGGDATRLVDWMAEHRTWPQGLRVHSANPVGAATMMRTVVRYAPYTSGGPRTFGKQPPGGWPALAAAPG